eukprot:GHRR01000266.1.p1 GENE.GHRR01000266.1~~GHRR01000266.1.p1  ORF type:complete len:171 (+),score=25.45 GHRR01000266.1:76-588(+)
MRWVAGALGRLNELFFAPSAAVLCLLARCGLLRQPVTLRATGQRRCNSASALALTTFCQTTATFHPMALSMAKPVVAQRPALAQRSATVARPSLRRTMRVQATSAKAAEKATLAASVAAAAMAVAPAAHAAHEVMLVANGEPAIVQIGWAAVCVMFSFSLSLVVWGRSGM